MPLLHRFDQVPRALPFWVSLGLFPVVIFAATRGGWALLLPPLASWGLFTLLDRLVGKDELSPDPDSGQLAWHSALLWVWAPMQVVTLFGLIAAAPQLTLSGGELVGLFFGVGVLTGTVGITYSHELIHRPGRMARRLGDILLSAVLYSHFRTEHLLVHHVWVATPKDPATARYGEGFWHYFRRVLPGSLRSAWSVEADRQRKRGTPVYHLSNPFWTYGALQLTWVLVAVALGGWMGLGLFLWQALVAVWQLELVNYVEHYGLVRRRLEDGRYEPVGPHHSWNTDHAASNWLLINLQRHADHHLNPTRAYPLLQTYDSATAPQLPAGYPVMTLLAMAPRAWRARMNPRVRAWRQRHYPEVTDWPAGPGAQRRL